MMIIIINSNSVIVFIQIPEFVSTSFLVTGQTVSIDASYNQYCWALTASTVSGFGGLRLIQGMLK